LNISKEKENKQRIIKLKELKIDCKTLVQVQSLIIFFVIFFFIILEFN